MIDLSITIVNYNTGQLLKQCLKSIYQETKNISFEIIVVDNASSDGSVEMLKNEFPEVNPASASRGGVKVIANKENLFFTHAHNQALRISRGRYLMLLNSDTVILDGVFDKMAQFMDEHPECGACGPKFLNPDNTLQGIGHRFPNFWYGVFQLSFVNTFLPENFIQRKREYQDIGNMKSIMEIDATGGACMMVRRETINDVGMLDENFLIYWEETDWCYRIRKNNWKIFYLPFAEIIHLGGAATVKKSKILSYFFEKIFYDSMLYYYRKHYGYFGYLALKLIFICFTRPVLKIVRFAKSVVRMK